MATLFCTCLQVSSSATRSEKMPDNIWSNIRRYQGSPYGVIFFVRGPSQFGAISLHSWEIELQPFCAADSTEPEGRKTSEKILCTNLHLYFLQRIRIKFSSISSGSSCLTFVTSRKSNSYEVHLSQFISVLKRLNVFFCLLGHIRSCTVFGFYKPVWKAISTQKVSDNTQNYS